MDKKREREREFCHSGSCLSATDGRGPICHTFFAGVRALVAALCSAVQCSPARCTGPPVLPHFATGRALLDPKVVSSHHTSVELKSGHNKTMKSSESISPPLHFPLPPPLLFSFLLLLAWVMPLRGHSDIITTTSLEWISTYLQQFIEEV